MGDQLHAAQEVVDHAGCRAPQRWVVDVELVQGCLLYTSDAADERSSVDLGGRRIIKKKNWSGKEEGRTRYCKIQSTQEEQR